MVRCGSETRLHMRSIQRQEISADAGEESGVGLSHIVQVHDDGQVGLVEVLVQVAHDIEQYRFAVVVQHEVEVGVAARPALGAGAVHPNASVGQASSDNVQHLGAVVCGQVDAANGSAAIGDTLFHGVEERPGVRSEGRGLGGHHYGHGLQIRMCHAIAILDVP